MASVTPGRPIAGMPSAINPAAALAEADRLRQAGRIDEAIALCRKVVAAQPELLNALNMLALLLRTRGENGEAEGLLRRAIAAAPREAALHNNLGNVLFAVGDKEGARAAYRTALSLRSDYAEASYNLGVVLRDLGQSEEALAAQRRAIALRPDYAQALVQLGVLLMESGRSEEALVPLEAAMKADPKFYDAGYYRGTALLDLERFEDAIPVLRTTVDIAPERHEARYAIAKAFVHTGQEDYALFAYQSVFERKPDFIPALQDFTALAWSTGNGERSLLSFSIARSKIGDTPDLLLAEANLRLRFVDALAEPAEMMLRRASDMAPGRADIANALARALAEKQRYDEAFPLFQQAVAMEPQVIKHRQDLGEALLARHEFAAARDSFEGALTLNAHDQIALAGFTLALRALGDSRYHALVDQDRFVREYEIAPPPGFTDIAAFNTALARELEKLHTRGATPIDQTLRNGTQSAGSLFAVRNAAIEGVREQIRAAVADYIANLPDDAGHPLLSRKQKDFTFSGSWSCRLRSTGFHTNHVHDQGWISSAYYVSLPEEITDGGQGGLKFGESRFNLGGEDRSARLIKPAVGKLVLFPSYYWHGTVPFESSQARLAIAFDVVPGQAAPRKPLLVSY